MYDCHCILPLPPLAKEDQEGSWMALMARCPLPAGSPCSRNHQVHSLCPPLRFLCKEIKVIIMTYLAGTPILCQFVFYRFWILPNLTKDVGFLKSFWPLFDYTYTGEYIGDNTEEEDGEGAEKITHEDSDSNESGKSGFEFVDKNKDD